MNTAPSPRRSGLLLAALQSALLLAIGGQMLLERMVLPRGWVITEAVDPNLPIRGRYIVLRVAAPAKELRDLPAGRVRFVVRHGQVEAINASNAQPGSSEPLPASLRIDGRGTMALLNQPLAFFLPPDVPDPSNRPQPGSQGERLWVEVTLPRRGLPRPIRLGLGPENGGAITPLQLR